MCNKATGEQHQGEEVTEGFHQIDVVKILIEILKEHLNHGHSSYDERVVCEYL